MIGETRQAWARRAGALAVLLVLTAGDPRETAGARELLVSAAVSLTETFEVIGAAFEAAHPGVEVRFNFGSSGALEQQVERGAPADAFASAGAELVEALASRDLVDRATQRTFAQNALVIVQPRKTRAPIADIIGLADEAVKRVVIGNPTHVPAGQYAAEALRRAGLWKSVATKLIFAEHVRQALTYIVRDEVDAGLVYKTDATIGGEEVRIVSAVPDSLHSPILYTIVVVRTSAHPDEAAAFCEWLLTPASQRTLAAHGFISVAE